MCKSLPGLYLLSQPPSPKSLFLSCPPYPSLVAHYFHMVFFLFQISNMRENMQYMSSHFCLISPDVVTLSYKSHDFPPFWPVNTLDKEWVYGQFFSMDIYIYDYFIYMHMNKEYDLFIHLWWALRLSYCEKGQK